MDIVKKTINIENFTAHAPVIMPFYELWSGNTTASNTPPMLPTNDDPAYGNILADYMGYSDSTLSLLRKYFRINEISRTGIKLKRVSTVNGECYTDVFSDEVRASRFKIYNLAYFEIINEHLYRETDDHEQQITEEYISLVTNEDYGEYLRLNVFSSETHSTLVEVVENEIIGLVDVPIEIKGELVPEKFYLMDVDRWLRWFDKHQKGDDCCKEDEWNKRGGEDMLSFLTSLISIRDASLAKWQRNITLGKMVPPKIAIPLLLTQNYDDIGEMDASDDGASYKKNKAGIHDDISFEDDLSVVSESKLKTLRSRTIKYDRETGEPLPYIGDGHIPYKVGERFNEMYDPETDEHYADYITSITYFNEDGDVVAEEYINDENEVITSGDTTQATYATFEYVIAGKYNPSISSRLKMGMNQTVYEWNYDDLIDISVTAETGVEWIVVSEENCSVFEKWSDAMTVVFTSNNESMYEDRIARIAIATTTGDYEEVSISFTQQHAPYVPSCTIDAVPNSVVSRDDTQLSSQLVVTTTGSGWYVASKPDFLRVLPERGNVGSKTVTAYLEPYNSDGLPRMGEIVFKCLNDSQVMETVNVIQGEEIMLKTTVLQRGASQFIPVSPPYTQGYNSIYYIRLELCDYGGTPLPITLTEDDWTYGIAGNTSAVKTKKIQHTELGQCLVIINQNTLVEDEVIRVRILLRALTSIGNEFDITEKHRPII